jgi:hypothetical protein
MGLDGWWCREMGGDTDPAFPPILHPICIPYIKVYDEKNAHQISGGPGIRTRHLPHAKWRATRLATVLHPSIIEN